MNVTSLWLSKFWPMIQSAPFGRPGRGRAPWGSDPELAALAGYRWGHSKFTLSDWKTKLAPGKGQGYGPS